MFLCLRIKKKKNGLLKNGPAMDEGLVFVLFFYMFLCLMIFSQRTDRKILLLL